MVCLGCLIRGATPHFEYIASACAHGITAAAASTGVPMSFGVLTTNSAEEALERAAPGPSNKGREAADAAVEMARLFAQHRRRPRDRSTDRTPMDTETRWAGRHRARAAALQALYECEVGGLTPQQALGVLHHAGPPEVDDPGEDEHAFVIALVRGAMERPRRARRAHRRRREELARRADGDRSIGW